ncbi:NDR1/HIN1-like protein 6 [Cryptomeria japonica]|uniref:NDR1/HIN1-like protein 6 n=1 Tax=Cryptomeria japonica TaxID=3369 RepID=UPI0027D9EB7D|nr:NDR1/HIN1-like protein 6 [Cryptomeria japonica]
MWRRLRGEVRRPVLLWFPNRTPGPKILIPLLIQARVLRVNFPREFPRFYSHPPKRRQNFCCLCLIWTLYFLLLLIVATVIAAAILYSVFQPRIPKYSVDKFQITSFALGPDATVSSQFGMVVRARNPNEKIGIDYLENSYLGVFYIGTELCRGKLPAFYQGHGSTDNLNVNLTGNQVHITSEMVSSLTAQRQQGNIPLRLKADVPVKIEFGKLKTMKITFRLRCDLVVDRLDDNTSVDISRKKCKVKL